MSANLLLLDYGAFVSFLKCFASASSFRSLHEDDLRCADRDVFLVFGQEYVACEIVSLSCSGLCLSLATSVVELVLTSCCQIDRERGVEAEFKRRGERCVGRNVFQYLHGDTLMEACILTLLAYGGISKILLGVNCASQSKM